MYRMLFFLFVDIHHLWWQKNVDRHNNIAFHQNLYTTVNRSLPYMFLFWVRELAFFFRCFNWIFLLHFSSIYFLVTTIVCVMFANAATS